ncbi:unnamed protein product [Caenorhabditis brenneri]
MEFSYSAQFVVSCIAGAALCILCLFCFFMDKLTKNVMPIREEEMQRIITSHRERTFDSVSTTEQTRNTSPVSEVVPVQIPFTANPPFPHVIIQIDPPESDEEEMYELSEISEQETPILTYGSDDEEGCTSL